MFKNIVKIATKKEYLGFLMGAGLMAVCYEVPNWAWFAVVMCVLLGWPLIDKYGN